MSLKRRPAGRAGAAAIASPPAGDRRGLARVAAGGWVDT